MTRAQWLIEEEERLIRVRDEIDSILGVHAANCGECSHDFTSYCRTAGNIIHAKSIASIAVGWNQARQDEERPMPVYRPVVAG